MRHAVQVCGEGLVRTAGVAVQRAAAHCLNAVVALHPDMAKLIFAALPQVSFMQGKTQAVLATCPQAG